jgi:MerR family transcriptional regulator, light-induced transcriptional regulator
VPMANSDISLHDVAEMLDVHYMTVYRYVRQGQLPATKVGRSWYVKPSDLELFRDAKVHTSEVSEGGKKIAPWAERLEAQLIQGDQRGAAEIMEAVLRSGHDLYFLYLQVLSPAMSAIGARWAAGNLEIFVEHRASNIAMRLIGQFGPRFARRGVSKGTVVLGSPADEMHTLSTSMVADLIRLEGWNVSDVGANMPAEAFAEAIRQGEDVVAVCIGVTMPGSLPAAQATIGAIRKVVPRDLPILVGGAGVASDEIARDLGADRRSGSVYELIEVLGEVARRS